MPLNILVCLKIHFLAEGLVKLFENTENIKVIGCLTDEDELQKIENVKADVILADYEFFDAILEHIYMDNRPKILIISSNTDEILLHFNLKSMIDKGLSGIIHESTDATLLKKAIIQVSSGELWIDRKTISRSLRGREAEKRDIKLTKKEIEVLKYICKGDSNKSIAQELSVSEQTIKSHCNHLFKKFNVENRVKLALHASKINFH